MRFYSVETTVRQEKTNLKLKKLEMKPGCLQKKGIFSQIAKRVIYSNKLIAQTINNETVNTRKKQAKAADITNKSDTFRRGLKTHGATLRSRATEVKIRRFFKTRIIIPDIRNNHWLSNNSYIRGSNGQN